MKKIYNNDIIEKHQHDIENNEITDHPTIIILLGETKWIRDKLERIFYEG